jgi:hypothetical protein
VRAGETITDIISKRNITRAEVDALNPEVNLDRLSRGWLASCIFRLFSLQSDQERVLLRAVSHERCRMCDWHPQAVLLCMQPVLGRAYVVFMSICYMLNFACFFFVCSRPGDQTSSWKVHSPRT